MPPRSQGRSGRRQPDEQNSRRPSKRPKKPEKSDPETDEKLRAKIRSDYKEKLADINQRKQGMSTNEGNQYKRREVAKLLKRLATESNLTEDQVKKMAGLK